MAYKRKRNVKIDNGAEYAVNKPGDADVSGLEEYVPPALDTGMEADEEKELHLKRIMEGGKGDIPIPVIVEAESPAREAYGHYVRGRKYVEWGGDGENGYLMDDEALRLCKESGTSVERFLAAVCTMSREQTFEEGDRWLAEMVGPRILTRSEKFGLPAYVCFRKRIIKPNRRSRRSRRSEELSKEKVERMWGELDMLGALCDLYSRRKRLERALERVESELVQASCVLMRSGTRRTRRAIAKKLMDEKHGAPGRGTGSAGGAVGDMMVDRARIRLLRRQIHEAREKACLGDHETEIRALRKHNEMYRT